MGICSYSDETWYVPMALVSIDNGRDVLRQQQFNAWLADRAIGNKRVHGQYILRSNGDDLGAVVFEPSWLMRTADFSRFILDTAWVMRQESVLLLSAGKRRYFDVPAEDDEMPYVSHMDVRPARLRFIGDSRQKKDEDLGFLYETTRERAMDLGEFTVDGLGVNERPRYFICGKLEGTRDNA